MSVRVGEQALQPATHDDGVNAAASPPCRWPRADSATPIPVSSEGWSQTPGDPCPDHAGATGNLRSDDGLSA
jgi:hypothetical protein